MSAREFAAQRLIARTPWDVYEFLADESQQAAWRERHETRRAIESAEPYTRIEYAGGSVFTVEPQDEHTLLTLTRRVEPKSTLAKLASKLMNRSTHEAELVTTLARIEAALVYDAA